MKKRGISPLIATVLILGLVIVLVVVIFSWLTYMIQQETEDTDISISSFTSKLNFEFSCENNLDNGQLTVSIHNEYNGPIDSAFFVLDDGTEFIDLNIQAFESKTIFLENTVSSEVKIVPRVGDQEYNYLSQTKSCFDVIQFSCGNGVDDDGDGEDIKDIDDPDCHSDLDVTNSDSYDEELIESGTYSCNSCNSCQQAITEGLSSDGIKSYLLMNDLDSDQDSCINLEDLVLNNIIIDCGGYTLTCSGSCGGVGINVPNLSNDDIIIKNCNIFGFNNAGIEIAGTNLQVINVGTGGGADQTHGIFIQGGSSTATLVDNYDFEGNGNKISMIYTSTPFLTLEGNSGCHTMNTVGLWCALPWGTNGVESEGIDISNSFTDIGGDCGLTNEFWIPHIVPGDCPV